MELSAASSLALAAIAVLVLALLGLRFLKQRACAARGHDWEYFPTGHRCRRCGKPLG
jgi:hypothetical protein